MAGIFSFKCSSCDNIHEGSPSFAFRAPDPYIKQSEEIQNAGKLSGDLCWYDDEDGRHYFIRACLEVPIHGVSEPFLWGVWASVSKRNYDRYLETYDTPVTTDSYFGWFCNYLPYYQNTFALKVQIRPREDGSRPYLELEETPHPLSSDFHNGISILKAQEIAEELMHR